jgi:hypothetical protein
MNGRMTIRAAVVLATLGTLVCLALLVRETPWTLTAFMFLGQPLIAAAVVIYLVHVVRDIRRSGLL